MVSGCTNRVTKMKLSVAVIFAEDLWLGLVVVDYGSYMPYYPSAQISGELGNDECKYQAAGPSEFSTYPSHYAQHQKPIPDQPYPAAYQIQRIQQPGYLASQHSASTLHQQFQHANEKSGFNDGDKNKLQQ